MKPTGNKWVATYDQTKREIVSVSFNGVELMTKSITVEQYAGKPLLLKFEVFVFNDEFIFAEKKETDAQEEQS